VVSIQIIEAHTSNIDALRAIDEKWAAAVDGQLTFDDLDVMEDRSD
jgi:hypothetical protein